MRGLRSFDFVLIGHADLLSCTIHLQWQRSFCSKSDVCQVTYCLLITSAFMLHLFGKSVFLSFIYGNDHGRQLYVDAYIFSPLTLILAVTLNILFYFYIKVTCQGLMHLTFMPTLESAVSLLLPSELWIDADVVDSRTFLIFFLYGHKETFFFFIGQPNKTIFNDLWRAFARRQEEKQFPTVGTPSSFVKM